MGNTHSEVKKIYEDFEPFCKFHRGEGQDSMDIELQPGFKKEHIKVKIDKGSVIISGERALDPPKWLRFRKEIKNASDYNEEQIRARLPYSDHTLTITLPKKKTLGGHLKKQVSRVSSKLTRSISKLQERETKFAIKYGKDIMFLLFNLVIVLGLLAIALGIYYCVTQILDTYNHKQGGN